MGHTSNKTTDRVKLKILALYAVVVLYLVVVVMPSLADAILLPGTPDFIRMISRVAAGGLSLLVAVWVAKSVLERMDQ